MADALPGRGLASSSNEHPGFTRAAAVVSTEMTAHVHPLESVQTVGTADRPEVR